MNDHTALAEGKVDKEQKVNEENTVEPEDDLGAKDQYEVENNVTGAYIHVGDGYFSKNVLIHHYITDILKPDYDDKDNIDPTVWSSMLKKQLRVKKSKNLSMFLDGWQLSVTC